MWEEARFAAILQTSMRLALTRQTDASGITRDGVAALILDLVETENIERLMRKARLNHPTQIARC